MLNNYLSDVEVHTYSRFSPSPVSKYVRVLMHHVSLQRKIEFRVYDVSVCGVCVSVVFLLLFFSNSGELRERERE